MQQDLTRGSVIKSMLLFAVPMILGNLLQQLYNIADTLIVGRYLGPDALAAVGASFTLMTFLTSILLTAISLGVRVALAYLLAPIPAIGLVGIWWAIPIGWLLADLVGLLYFRRVKNQLTYAVSD